MKTTINYIVTLATALIISSAVHAAPPVMSVGSAVTSAGQSANIPVTFTSGDSQVSAVQFDIILPANISAGAVNIGAAAAAAQKSLASSAITNGIRLLIFGFNSDPINSGVLATITLNVAAGTPPAAYPIGITGVSASSPTGSNVNLPASSGMITVPGATTTKRVSGRVLLNGVGLPNVTVTSNAGIRTTNSSGEFAFDGISYGASISLTPSLSGYQFAPSSWQGIISDDISVNFAASPIVNTTTYNLSGSISGPNGPLAGVQVNGGALGTRTTDTNGQYLFSGIPSGTNYTITPNLVGYSFNPSSRSGLVTGDTIGNFSAFTSTTSGSLSISGKIRAGRQLLGGVRINGGALGDRTTDPQGQFNFSALAKGTRYVLTPSLAGYYFVPSQLAGTLSYSRNFSFRAIQLKDCPTCTPGTFTVSGRIASDNVGVPGVSVRVGNSYGITDSNGRYTIPGLPPGRYTTSARLRGFRLLSQQGTRLNITNTNVINDFSASCSSRSKRFINGVCDYPRYSLSGRIMLGQTPMADVELSAGSFRTKSDSNGNFRFTGLRAFNYTVRPRLRGGYILNPGSIKVSLGQDVSGVNFAISCSGRYMEQGGRCVRKPR